MKPIFKYSDVLFQYLVTGIIAATFIVTTFIPAPVFSADSAGGKIAATVNGAPIFKKEVDKGVPKDAFGPALKKMRKKKLENLIYSKIVKQFIARKKISVDPQRVDQRIAYLRKYPPAITCSCCRYESLEQFMKLNHYTLDELREEIRVNMGLNDYVDRLWNKKYNSDDKRKKLLDENRNYIELTHFNVSHIFFNMFQDPEYIIRPDRVIHRNQVKAKETCKRLKNGESFDSLAKELSEDSVSKEKGGMLGGVKKDIFGLMFLKAADKLSPGQYSPPVQTIWGVHIVRRNELTDTDIMEILKDQHRDGNHIVLIKKLMDEAEIIRYDPAN